MRMFLGCFLLSFLVSSQGFCESFLKAQSFPTTFEDLSFTERMDVLADGYEDLLEATYDANGQCIKGCAYYGLNIVQEEALLKSDAEDALKESEEYSKKHKDDDIDVDDMDLSPDVKKIIKEYTKTNNDAKSGQDYPKCKDRNESIPKGQKSPWGMPLKGAPRVSSPYGVRRKNGKIHRGIDFAVVEGTSVYTPADGTVIAVWEDKACGKGIIIQHEDKTFTGYCHLSKQLVSKGQRIGAGCKIAKSGNTGTSTGPHLHYLIKNKNGKKINPIKYINHGK